MKLSCLVNMLLGGALVALLSIPGNVRAQNDPFGQPQEKGLEEELEWLQAEKFAITASRVLENVKKSAASITVITDKEIEQMGARHLMDVLQTVPGMSAWYYLDGIYKVDSRGLMKSTGQHILLMVNSHPLNENFTGGFPTFDTIMLGNVKQIEIIRGPGSALYGANAFAGVINIITKDADDIDGIQATARGGSYQTQEYNALVGKTFGDLKITLNANYINTDGFESHISQDRQTALDALFGTHASLAPGDAQNWEERYDVTLGLEYKGLKFEGRYIDGDANRPLSLSNALTEKNSEPWTDSYLRLNYARNLMEGWDISANVYYTVHDMSSDLQQGLPPGAAMPSAPAGAPAVFPEGVLVQLGNKNARTGAEVQSQYKLGETHTLVGGLTYEYMEQYDVTYAANFLYTSMQNVVIPLPTVQDLSDPDTSYNKNVSRTFMAAFMEDLWDVTDSLRFTLGARYDNYSDFGGSFNPRAGAVWEFKTGYNLKLLYGRAFRAPSFYELYSRNNPSFIGNPDIAPEIINTYEISLGAEVTEALTARLTGFRNSVKDSVDIVTVQQGEFSQRIFQNKDELQTQGVELELTYDFGKGTYLGANYTFQDGENVDTGEGFWYNPVHKGNVMANLRLTKYFNWFTNVYFEGMRNRTRGDVRKDPEGFMVVNTTLIAKKFFEGLEVRASVYNLLDEEYVIPTSKDSLPVDFPMPGRSFMVEARYTF